MVLRRGLDPKIRFMQIVYRLDVCTVVILCHILSPHTYQNLSSTLLFQYLQTKSYINNHGVRSETYGGILGTMQ